MKVKVLTRINVENTAPNREPAWVVFGKAENIVVANGQIRIGYRQVEKEKIQQVMLPVDKLHEVVLEFF